MNDIIVSVISGGAVVAIIEGIREWLRWLRERKAKKEDAETENADNRIASLEEAVKNQSDILKAQSEALKYIMFDRIRYLGQVYIRAAEIDFDDRRVLNDMHHSYHYGLGGNGDLDVLMSTVNELPLKKR